uniref:Protein JTB n=1 Tax=Timema bartmani TaxID=61472 RepID=A0A7R9EXD8_9NEOP|nr:unnamed protein product [Timema bartmani]
MYVKSPESTGLIQYENYSVFTLTLLVLILESHWTSVGARSYPTVSGKNNSSDHGCWLHEEYQIVEPCHLCTDFEIASKSNFVCVPTHFKEVIQCQISGKASRSCDKVTWLEERNFWIFEGVMRNFHNYCICPPKSSGSSNDAENSKAVSKQCLVVSLSCFDSVINMDDLFVEIFSKPTDGGDVSVSLETLITACTLKYCQNPHVSLSLVLKKAVEPSFTINLSSLDYELIDESNLPSMANMCQLPLVLIEDGCTVVAGLCGILRQVIKKTTLVSPNHFCHDLLGFRHGCLMACSESSMWTRFCEVDMIGTVKDLILNIEKLNNVVFLPEDIVRFETHLAQPLRVHNIQKKTQDHFKSLHKKSSNSNLNDCQENISVLEHTFAEGPLMTLADIVLLPCFYIVLETIRSVYLQQYLPLTLKWFQLVMAVEHTKDAIGIIKGVKNMILDKLYVKYIVPDVPKQSLYKSDPRRYKPRNRIFTRQEDVENSLKMALELGIFPDWQTRPFGWEQEFDWSSLPNEAHPEGGNLPLLRQERKGQQLENLTKAVLKVARPGHTIVDFCSGSGHLGIIIAHLLPRCQVVLLENKEESLTRARQRVSKLHLPNVTFCQSNLDYYCGNISIGVSLHACGVATDLVIQRCIQQRAVFVCCPCCYGSVQQNHVLTYPRSKTFRDSAITLRDYLVLGHSADQTHDDKNAKTEQGKLCMAVIDVDRCMQAQELGYWVSLAKLVPESCTPKNNLLVGIPAGWG